MRLLLLPLAFLAGLFAACQPTPRYIDLSDDVFDPEERELRIRITRVSNLEAGIWIDGQVMDSIDAEPVLGATVIIEGTPHGVVTGWNGHFSLDSLHSEQRLVFSFIGYRPRSIPVGELAVSQEP